MKPNRLRLPIDIAMTLLSIILMRRILQTLVNCGILVCVIFLMISGIILSNHLFTFLGIESGLGFARTSHLLASHWYFLFMSLHIGLHVAMIAGKMKLLH